MAKTIYVGNLSFNAARMPINDEACKGGSRPALVLQGDWPEGLLNAINRTLSISTIAAHNGFGERKVNSHR